MATKQIQTVLVTGANSGVGYAITHALFHAPEPYRILLAGRNQSSINEATATIRASNPSPNPSSTIHPLHLDVDDSASITAAADLVTNEFKSLDCLINNAAISGLSLPNDDSVSSLKTRLTSTLTTNVIGAALVSAAFRPLLMQSPYPRSIYVSSGAGRFSWVEPLKPHAFNFPGGESYSVSKAALNMLAVQEYKTWGEKGLKVFTTTPGFVVSNLRGKDEGARTGWGKAQPAEASGRFHLEVVRGDWDGEGVGRFISIDGGVKDW